MWGSSPWKLVKQPHAFNEHSNYLRDRKRWPFDDCVIISFVQSFFEVSVWRMSIARQGIFFPYVFDSGLSIKMIKVERREEMSIGWSVWQISNCSRQSKSSRRWCLFHWCSNDFSSFMSCLKGYVYSRRFKNPNVIVLKSSRS